MGKYFCSISLLTVVSSILWLIPAGAQERKGGIAGEVTDAGKGVLYTRV
jgi:Tfp pilus assembly protein PilZ